MHGSVVRMGYAAGLLALAMGCSALASDNGGRTAAGLPVEGEAGPFVEKRPLTVQEQFRGERLPNVVVGTDGTVVTSWGWGSVMVRRSEDGGETWGPAITVALGLNCGGMIVDENSGDLLLFVEADHPPAPLTIYRSTDQGRTWTAQQETVIRPDSRGNVPSMCMNERGITLRHGPHAGRLIRPSRWYAASNHPSEWPNHYTNAIYSDDGGRTWQTSEPFPANGTGEAAIAELSDGRLYYNSRRHWAPEGINARMRWIAWSEDGGATWEDLSISDALPDGEQHRDYGLMCGLVRLPIAGRDILLFSNIESPRGRTHGTVWASFDGGRTWPVKRLFNEEGFAYSSLAAGRPGTPSEGWVYMLYEDGGHPNATGRVARFNLSWLLDGKDMAQYFPDGE